MKIALFYHSLISDWNHGNAHFLRGVTTELLELGHEVKVYEPWDAWSVQMLLEHHGEEVLADFQQAYPQLESIRYAAELDLDEALDGVDLAIVHEWNSHELVARIGAYRASHPKLRLLFHDTHHRLISEPAEMEAYDLRHYDGVLAYGEVLRRMYLEKELTAAAWTWHEAADTRVFRPLPEVEKRRDLVWVGNWGDDERTEELAAYLLGPIQQLGLSAEIFGVRYPVEAVTRLEALGVAYRNWAPNFAVPHIFAEARVTVHVPRRPYTRQLPGIPTIRPFEALACGIPLVSAPWSDVEGLFRVGTDFLMAESPKEMQAHLRDVLHDPALASSLAQHGRQTILAHHTCRHRVEQLLDIYAVMAPPRDELQAA